MLLTAGYFWEHALVFHNKRGWASPAPTVSWVQGHLLQPLHISPQRQRLRAVGHVRRKSRSLPSPWGRILQVAQPGRVASWAIVILSTHAVLPPSGGDRCGCQLPFFRTRYGKMTVAGLCEQAVLAEGAHMDSKPRSLESIRVLDCRKP